MSTHRKKLIEVALPLAEINEGTKPETENPFLKGHPRAVHNWWARTPLSMCRAILFAQLVDDPGEGLSGDHADRARKPLMDLIRQLGTWDATADSKVLDEARAIIKRQFGEESTCAWDPFAGRGSISIEAQRLGLRVFSSDLNPVAVTIQKALLDYVQRFADLPPVNPESRESLGGTWAGSGSSGLTEDLRYYSRWMRDEAERRLGQLYPKIGITSEMTRERPDLKPYAGRELTVTTWLWARTVASPNPAARGAHVPLVSSFMLSTKGGRKSWVELVTDHSGSWRFEPRSGTLDQEAEAIAKLGTKAGRAKDFVCCLTGSPIQRTYVQAEGKAGRLGERLMVIVVATSRGREYLAPIEAHEKAALAKRFRTQASEARSSFLSGATPTRAMITGGVCSAYGLSTWGHLFTDRQLVALTTYSDLVNEARTLVKRDFIAARPNRQADDPLPLSEGGRNAQAYADAVATYLACALSRMTDYHCSLATWNPTNENTSHLFQRQAIPMAWDFAEANPLDGRLDFSVAAGWIADSLKLVAAQDAPAEVFQFDAASHSPPVTGAVVVSTDPPYYDNIGYAELSDFFYVWLRRALRSVDPTLFRTVLTPKAPELIASPYRHNGSSEAAEAHFRDGIASAFRNLNDVLDPSVPMTVYYAFKQSETATDLHGEAATASTGWASMLEGLLGAGFAVTGTWPVRTTKKARAVARNANALASAIVIVCRKRVASAPVLARREFTVLLRRELPDAIQTLRRMNVAPVDLRQAAIGPGMAVFSRNAQVLEADGSPMTVRQALVEINRALDETIAGAADDLDVETRFCVAWFEQYGVDERNFGEAEVLFTATDTSFEGLRSAGVLFGGRGKVRLRRRDEFGADWKPGTDGRIADWECVQHLVRAMTAESGGGVAEAARLAAAMGPTRAERARSLAYRLHAVSERKGWTTEALAYNVLATSWPQIQSAMVQRDTTQSLLPGMDSVPQPAEN